MPRTSAANLKIVDITVKAMKKHPTLSVREAMLIAGFSPDDSINKTVQRKILRRLPGQGKRKFAALQILEPTPSSTPSAAAANDSVSPLTDPTISEQEANILSTHTLTECGFDGSILKEEISALNERREKQNITEEKHVVWHCWMQLRTVRNAL